LAKWVSRQRGTRDQISDDRTTRLESLPEWIWDVYDFQWSEGYSHLQRYVEIEGHARIPNNFKTVNGFRLGSWVLTQRRNRNLLSDNRVAKLEALPGWVWDAIAFKWDEGYSYLQRYVELEGHARVPWNYITTEGFKLGSWVGNQRTRRNKATDEQISKLELLPGWVWKV